jgi:Cu/Ag efflux pump CusA
VPHFSFLTERINEILSGYTGAVVVNIYGPDLNEFDNQAVRVAAVLAKTPGAREVQIQSPPGMPQVMVRLRPSDVARWGFDSVQVLDVLQTAFAGDVVGQVYEGNQVFPVSVILNPADRQSVSAIASLPVRRELRSCSTACKRISEFWPLHDLAYRGTSRASGHLQCGRR